MAQKKKLEGRCQVTVDLSRLSLTDLEWLYSGVSSAIEARRRNDVASRCWIVPSVAVEVTVEG